MNDSNQDRTVDTDHEYYPPRLDMQTGLLSMLGKTFSKVTGKVDDYKMIFETANGEKYIFSHDQDCCESVTINDLVGNLEDLIGSPLLIAEEFSGVAPVDYESPNFDHDSYTFTFYKFATVKGYVDVRWLGESNGYYSESVDLFFKAAQ